jgi:hypothetical protein
VVQACSVDMACTLTSATLLVLCRLQAHSPAQCSGPALLREGVHWWWWQLTVASLWAAQRAAPAGAHQQLLLWRVLPKADSRHQRLARSGSVCSDSNSGGSVGCSTRGVEAQMQQEFDTELQVV